MKPYLAAMAMNAVAFSLVLIRLTKKAEPPPTRGVNRDSGTASANGGWLRRLVRLLAHLYLSHALLPTARHRRQRLWLSAMTRW